MVLRKDKEEKDTAEHEESAKSSPLLYLDRDIAAKYGHIAGFLFNRIKWSINHHRKHNETQFYQNGRWWMSTTHEELKAYLSNYSLIGIRKSLKKLENGGLLIVKKHPRRPSNYALGDKTFTGQSDEELDKKNTTFTDTQYRSIRGDYTTFTDTQYRSLSIESHNPGYKSQPTGVEKRVQEGIEVKVIPFKRSPKEGESTTQIPKPRQSKKKPELELSAAELDLGKRWMTHALEEMPWKSADKEWTVEKFARDLRVVVEKANISLPDLGKVLDWLTGPDGWFWKGNAITPLPLIKRSDDLTKLDKIRNSMKQKRRSYHGSSEYTGNDRVEDDDKYAKYRDNPWGFEVPTERRPKGGNS